MDKLWKYSYNNHTTRLLAVIVIIGYILFNCPAEALVRADLDDAAGNATVCVGQANIRDAAGTVNTNIIATLDRGTRVTACEVVELTSDPSGQTLWCKIVFSISGSSKTGYIVDSFLSKDSGDPSDDEFEKEIASFPESYKSYLRVMHQAHPAWHFRALNVNRDFQETVNLESQVGVSLITNSANDAWKSTESFAYDWRTDTYIVYDGQTWVNAARSVVEYYLDPRNMLNEQYVFQFADLSYIPESQPIESVQCILNGTFMQSGTITNMKAEQVTYAQTFVRAAELSGANPVFLASKCLQEVGSMGSGSTSGNNGSLAGYYNYFNIGAYSSADPIAKGLTFAKNGTSDGNLNSSILIPWTTPYRAICGGSIFIASQYIAIGQNSIYLMRFNVNPKTSSQYGKHQYMTNIQGAAGESKKMFTAYSRAGILDTEIVFTIPVYQNMPDTPCSLPKQSGNPNNCLSQLSVEGYVLTPEFDALSDTQYSLVVPPTCTSVNVLAQTVSSKASVSGAGAVSLGDGVNQITIVVTAQNGSTRNYVINVARDLESPVNYFTVPLVATGTYYSGIAPDTTVEQLLSMFLMNEGYTLSYVNMNGAAKDPASKVATGDMFIVLDGAGASVYTGTLFIRGDSNGDGNISSADLTLITHYILGDGSLSASGTMASDANKDGKVNSADLTVIVRHILQTAPIVQ